MTRLLVMIGFIVSLVAASSAQVISPGTNDKCVGKVYGAKEVALRARLIDFKSPHFRERLAGSSPPLNDNHGSSVHIDP